MGGPLDGQSKEFSGAEYRVPQAMGMSNSTAWAECMSPSGMFVSYHIYMLKHIGGSVETTDNWGFFRSMVSIPVMAYMGMRVD